MNRERTVEGQRRIDVLNEAIEKIMQERLLDPKKNNFIQNMPRKYKLSEDENLTIPEKFNEYIKLQDKAIKILEKYILKFENDIEEKAWIPNLEYNLYVLELGKKRSLERGLEGFIGDIERFPKSKRPLLSLNRGFRECFGQGYDWQMEILDSVNAISEYHRNL